LHDAVELEDRGVPAVTLCTDAFLDSAVEHAAAYGRPDARIVSVQHPVAALSAHEVVMRADAVVERIVKQLVASR